MTCVIGCGPADQGKEDTTSDIDSFIVVGNAEPVNGREQIISSVDNGAFVLGISIDTSQADNLQVWVSKRQENIHAENGDIKIANVSCSYYPFCAMSSNIVCNYDISDTVRCGPSTGDRTVQDVASANIGTLVSGQQTDLYIVLLSSAPNKAWGLRAVPVTFRYN